MWDMEKESWIKDDEISPDVRTYTHDLLIWLVIGISVLAVAQNRHPIAHEPTATRLPHPGTLLVALRSVKPLHSSRCHALFVSCASDWEADLTCVVWKFSLLPNK